MYQENAPDERKKDGEVDNQLRRLFFKLDGGRFLKQIIVFRVSYEAERRL